MGDMAGRGGPLGCACWTLLVYGQAPRRAAEPGSRTSLAWSRQGDVRPSPCRLCGFGLANAPRPWSGRRESKEWLEVPESLGALLAEGLLAPAMGLATTGFVRAELARLERAFENSSVSKQQREAAGCLLQLLALVHHSVDSGPSISTWIAQGAKACGMPAGDLRKMTLKRKELSPAARSLVGKGLPTK